MKRSISILILVVGIIASKSAVAEEAPSPQFQWPDTEIQWVTSGSSLTQIATGGRYTHHHWYGELGMGGLSAFDNRENAFFLGLNLGRRIPLIPRLHLGIDVGYRHM